MSNPPLEPEAQDGPLDRLSAEVWRSLETGKRESENLAVELEGIARQLRSLVVFFEAAERLKGASPAEQERARQELLAAIAQSQAAVSGLSAAGMLSKLTLALLPASRGD